MSYADRLQKLVEYQNSIRTALTEKGATISSNSTFKDFPAAVGTITGDYDGPTPVEIAENGLGQYYSLVTNATKIGSYAFVGAAISEAKFQKCQEIGESAFYSCQKLKMAKLDTCKIINKYAFGWCFGLSYVYAPSCSYIGDDAFYRCSSITSLDFPALISTGLAAFYSCKATVINTPLLKIANGTFSGCYLLSSIVLPNVELLSSGAFCSCSQLRTIVLGNPSKISCPTVFYTFGKCLRLESLYILASSICSLTDSRAFSSTPIGGYSTYTGVYGSIFVRESLLESYKKATNWTYFSARFVGLTDEEISNLKA